jgi:hypothetical protein
MTPDQLARSGSEHGEQRALFAWAIMAERYGFEVANDDRAYGAERDALLTERGWGQPAVELKWLHAIPNGGLRDKVTAGKLKAEGVKRGIPDVFLPLVQMKAPQHGRFGCPRSVNFAGLYIEMKRRETLKPGKRKAEVIAFAAGTSSAEQLDFATYSLKQGYANHVCYTWREAANVIEDYVRMTRTNA